MALGMQESNEQLVFGVVGYNSQLPNMYSNRPTPRTEADFGRLLSNQAIAPLLFRLSTVASREVNPPSAPGPPGTPELRPSSSAAQGKLSSITVHCVNMTG